MHHDLILAIVFLGIGVILGGGYMAARLTKTEDVIEEQDAEIASLIASRNSVVTSSARVVMDRDEKIKLLLDELGVARTRLSDLGYSVFAIDLTLKRFER
jgi:hypothetical protein